jgi:5-methylthioadenosine/S-adenosylhomocysteine deaminase
MAVLIENAIVVTMNPRDDVLDPGWIEVRDGAIAAVSASLLPIHEGDERIDGSGKVVIPGLVNAHTHLFQVLIRGIYEELPFPEWLRRIYHCGRALTAEDCHVAAMLGTLEALKSGVTTLVDHHFLNRGEELPEATLDGMRALGVRTVLARTIMDESPLAPLEVLETPEAGLRSVEALLRRHRDEVADGMLTLMLGPNTPGVSATGRLAVATRAFAEEHGLRQSAHIAESTSVLDAVRERHGHDGVVAWLDSIGALGPGLLAAHCVHLSPSEIAILARHGVAVCHNPVSNMFLGDGIAPVVELLAAGVTVGLGTDGAASNNSQDMFEVTKMAALLQRARTRDPHAISPLQALHMATIDGARVLGLDNLVGSIEPGKRADLAIVDLRRAPHNVAVHKVPSHLVHCAKATDVDTLLVDGRVVMRDRAVAGLDEPRLLAQAQEAGERLVARLD